MSVAPVHVSIHDVAPAWWPEVEQALDLCSRAGVVPALLVVPDYHGRFPLLAADDFCRRLRELQARGHEIHLHGFHHRAPPPSSGDRGLRGRLVTWAAQSLASSGEAELALLGEHEGRARIVEGEGVLRAAGLRAAGYVAPAWWMPRWLLSVLGERGFCYTEDHLRVYDPGSGRSRRSLVVNWASRSPARLLGSVAWCRIARHIAPPLPTRVAIHPSDMRVSLLRDEIRASLEWARPRLVRRGADLLS